MKSTKERSKKILASNSPPPLFVKALKSKQTWDDKVSSWIGLRLNVFAGQEVDCRIIKLWRLALTHSIYAHSQHHDIA